MKSEPDPEPKAPPVSESGRPMPAPPDKPAKAPDPDAHAVQGGKASDPKPLSKDEQMALYEEDLKENDWGHQPC